MKKVVFVAPYFMEATERFLGAATAIPEAQVALVSCDPLEKLSADIRARLVGHFAVNDVTTGELQRGIEGVAKMMGGVDRILGMLEQIQVPLGEVRDRLGVVGMGREGANNFRDKGLMKTVLRNAGLPTARHGVASSTPQALEIAGQIGFPMVVKPPDGAGAKGTFRCENFAQLQQALEWSAPQTDRPWMMEEFILGSEHSFDSVWLNGEVVWSSISHYSPGPLEVIRERWIQWAVMIPRETDHPSYRPIHQVAGRALQSLGMKNGLSHMEWFLRPDHTVAISEVGARPPGAQFTTLISYAHDFNLYRAWAELMIHDRFAVPQKKYATGIAYLRGMGRESEDAKVAQIRGIEAIAKTLGQFVVEYKLPQLGQSRSGSYEGEGYIVVRHPETEQVQQMLKQIITGVQIQLV